MGGLVVSCRYIPVTLKMPSDRGTKSGARRPFSTQFPKTSVARTAETRGVMGHLTFRSPGIPQLLGQLTAVFFQSLNPDTEVRDFAGRG